MNILSIEKLFISNHEQTCPFCDDRIKETIKVNNLQMRSVKKKYIFSCGSEFDMYTEGGKIQAINCVEVCDKQEIFRRVLERNNNKIKNK